MEFKQSINSFCASFIVAKSSSSVSEKLSFTLLFTVLDLESIKG